MLTQRLLFGVAVMLLASWPAYAFQADPETERYDVSRPIEHSLYTHGADQIQADPDAADFLGRLETALGRGWYITSWNQFARKARLVGGLGRDVRAPSR